MKTRRSQLGVTLLEVLISLAIIGSAIAGISPLVELYLQGTKSALTAQQMVTVGNAAQLYIKENYSTVLSSATATTPALITVPMLTAAGYLQPGFSTTNNYGQSVCVLVLEPVANNLNALVVAEGGTVIDDLTLGDIAGSIGASGGGIYSTAVTTLRGAMGGWNTSVGNFVNANASNQKCDGTAGTPTLASGHPIMALWFSNGDTSSAFLHRNDVPGRPELSTMNTPIIMAAVKSKDSPCTTTGAIARDSNGALLTCQNSVWKGGAGGLTWKGSVASVANLPASGNASGDAYRVTGAGNHVFVWDAQTGVWQGMVVDSAGNFTLPGLIYASGSNSTYAAITMQGSKNGWSGINFRDAAGNNSGTLMMNSTASGFYNTADNAWRWYVDNAGNSTQPGSITASGRITTGEFVQINGVATEGWGCSPNGLIGRDASGGPLYCKSGVWSGSKGGALGARSYISAGTSYCLPTDVFVGGFKQSLGATEQGLQIVVNGSVVAKSNGQSEGHLGFNNVFSPVKKGDCFYVGHVNGGGGITAWYVPLS